MKLPCGRFLTFAMRAFAVLLFVALLMLGERVSSQTTRTIKIIVPFAPGGSADFLARLLAEQVGRAYQGPTIVIESRPGAGTVIGTEAASRATPDGNTLLINAGGNLLISPHVRKVNFDPLTSFEPVCKLVSFPNVIAVNSLSPYRTLNDLIGAASSKPGELTAASPGPASDSQIAFEKLKRAANIHMTFVPYPGAAPAINALLGGHVTSAISSYGPMAEQAKAGKLRILATTTRTRIESLPEVPTVAEFGYKDYEVDVWWGLFAPAKTPKESVSQLIDWFGAALQAPEIAPKLLAQGLFPAKMCGPDFAALIRKQYDDFGDIIREAGIKE